MTSHSRIAAFGAAGVFVAGGILCALLLSGFLGPLLALMLIGSGLVLVTSLVFLEVGLSEDRARDRELARRAAARRRPRLRIRRVRGHG
jgi:fatty acid desaturase